MAPLKCIADNFLWIYSPNLFPSSGLSIGVNHGKNEKKKKKTLNSVFIAIGKIVFTHDYQTRSQARAEKQDLI